MTDESSPVDPRERARQLVRGMDADAYREFVQRSVPDIDGGDAGEDEALKQAGWPDQRTVELDMLATAPLKMALSAYLACALTGLSESQRDFVYLLSDHVKTICDQHDIELYEPRNITDPVNNADIEDWRVWKTDRARVLGSDLLIHLAHFPSTGSGQELGFAFEAMVPIIVVSHADHRVSRMVTGIPGLVYSVTYTEPEELRAELSNVLGRIRPVLAQRRTVLAGNSVNLFGARIRGIREQRGITVDELVGSSSEATLKRELIESWESATDAESNPSLVQMRELARLLGVTLSELVEPSEDDAVLGYLERYAAAQAARGARVSDADTRELMKRVLRRVIQDLDDS